ncbi:hypothetical protein EDD15DRAFT_2362122 [Pisolithus albus]|nr:hypothetical protein EDD15DRAFT_2362122 [Pisolithus albus]
MPPKRKIIYDDDSDDHPGTISPRYTVPETGLEEPTGNLGTSEMRGAVRRSSRSGKGTGGQLVHMKNLERVQTAAAPRPKRLRDLDAATEGDGVNPMAPSPPPPTPRAIPNKSRPKPRLKTKTGGPMAARLDLSPPSNIQPSFGMAAPNHQFGFRLPAAGEVNSIINCGSQRDVSSPSMSSGPPSSCASSIFSADASRASTAPTSRASSVCSLSRGNQENHQRAHGHSSLLKRLALASQSGIEAPHRISHVTPQNDIPQSRAPHLTQRPLHLGPQEDHRQSTTLEVPSLRLEESVTLPPLHREESDNPGFPPPCPAGLRRTVSFYDTPLDGIRLRGHTLSAVPDEDENHDPAGEGNYSDPPIDEASPNNAHAQTRSQARPPSYTEYSGPVERSSDTNDQGYVNANTEDVVAAHRQRNRAPRVPSNSQLHVIREQQASASSQLPQTQGMTHPPSATSQSLGGINPPTPPVGPATQGAEPWQIQFYKPAVQDVLERAKQFSYCDAASINSFPLRAHFNIKAIEYVEEAISERRSQGLPVTDGWWPHHANDICKLLWESLGNWRSALRKKARIYVTQRYKWDPENRREVNSSIAKDLLGDRGVFLRDGIDENTNCQGYTNNLAHPALAGLIIDFFYTSSSSSLGKLFPEVFSAEVPRVAVAIAATALKVILDEMVSSQSEVNFRVSTYTPVYLEILGLMKKCDTSVIHAEKTKSLRINWATLGSCAVEREPVTMAATGFDVDLD